MMLQLHKKRRKHVLLDIDTQRDFLLAAGNACVGNHAEVLANIRRIMAWARHQNIPIISTAEVHPDNNGSSLVRYCIDGTEGQRKISYTLLRNRVSFPADTRNALPVDLLHAYGQVVLHKRCTDPFDEPTIERLLSELLINEFILIGAGAEDAVAATAVGLLHRGMNVRVVADAVGGQTSRAGKLALRKMKARGARLTKTKDLAGSSHLRYAGACGCPSCRTKTTGQTGIEHLEIGAEHLRPMLG
ncbi:MAG: cysteine hydrolase family protein [Planctomycetota bacterium]|jgi:nicotinamidase-related amidase